MYDFKNPLHLFKIEQIDFSHKIVSYYHNDIFAKNSAHVFFSVWPIVVHSILLSIKKKYICNTGLKRNQLYHSRFCNPHFLMFLRWCLNMFGYVQECSGFFSINYEMPWTLLRPCWGKSYILIFSHFYWFWLP